MDRRSFLSASGAGLVGGWTKRGEASDDPSVKAHVGGRAYWAFVERSAEYELIACVPEAEGILVNWSKRDGSRYEINFIDSNYPTSVPVVVPVAHSNPELLIEGDIPYRISVCGLCQYSSDDTVVLEFDSPAAVKVYKQIRHGREIVVLTSRPSLRD